MDTPKLKVGDEVLVFTNPRRPGTPAEVVKIGRTLVHIKQYGQITTYRMDTQHFNGNEVGYGRWFRTHEQHAEDLRDEAARAGLRDAGLSIERGRTFTTDQLEAIADLVRSFTEEENTHG